MGRRSLMFMISLLLLAWISPELDQESINHFITLGNLLVAAVAAYALTANYEEN